MRIGRRVLSTPTHTQSVSATSLVFTGNSTGEIPDFNSYFLAALLGSRGRGPSLRVFLLLAAFWFACVSLETALS